MITDIYTKLQTMLTLDNVCLSNNGRTRVVAVYSSGMGGPCVHVSVYVASEVCPYVGLV